MAQTPLKGFFKPLEEEKKRKRQLPMDFFTEPIEVEGDGVICTGSTIPGGARLKSLEKGMLEDLEKKRIWTCMNFTIITKWNALK